MSEGQLSELPKEFESYLDKPYGGLFGDNVQIKIIEEIVADPYRNYRPKDFEELIRATAPPVRKALNNLAELGLLLKDTSDHQHPIYQPNLKSKKLVALTFLSYASIDDRDDSNCMDDAVLEYYSKVLREKMEPVAFATYTHYEVNGRLFTETFVSPGKPTEQKIKYVAVGA